MIGNQDLEGNDLGLFPDSIAFAAMCWDLEENIGQVNRDSNRVSPKQKTGDLHLHKLHL
jgi:hypothetical protein